MQAADRAVEPGRCSNRSKTLTRLRSWNRMTVLSYSIAVMAHWLNHFDQRCRCQLRSGQKGGACVDKIRRGKHTKITLGTVANGFPVGLELARGRPVKVSLDHSVRWTVERTFT